MQELRSLKKKKRGSTIDFGIGRYEVLKDMDNWIWYHFNELHDCYSLSRFSWLYNTDDVKENKLQILFNLFFFVSENCHQCVHKLRGDNFRYKVKNIFQKIKSVQILEISGKHKCYTCERFKILIPY
jgi:hypothetical protein